MGNRGQAKPGRLARAVLLCLGVMLGAPAFATECRDDIVDLRGEWGAARFSVELADDQDSRSRGLMHRESMARMAGMLFVYPESGPVRFWMKNTLISLDMIFLDEAGIVQRVHHDARPHDETPIFGGNDILAVLEVNGGMARTLGIAEGSEIRHPAFDPDSAAWPC